MSEDDDAAQFEQTVLTEVFSSVSNQFQQSRGPLRCSLYRSRENLDDIPGIILARWGKLTRRYECLIESESHLLADFDSPERDDLHGLRAPLEGLGTAIDPSSVWDMRGTVPDDATATVGEGIDPQAVIVYLRKSHDDQAGFENALVTALRDLIADTASGEPSFSFARWHFFDFAEHGSWDYLCKVTGSFSGPALPQWWWERIQEAGADLQVMNGARYDHVGTVALSAAGSESHGSSASAPSQFLAG